MHVTIQQSGAGGGCHTLYSEKIFQQEGTYVLGLTRFLLKQVEGGDQTTSRMIISSEEADLLGRAGPTPV